MDTQNGMYNNDPINPFIMGSPDLGYRTTPYFVPVDSWEPTKEDQIFVATKGYLIAPISNHYGFVSEDGCAPIDMFFLNTKRSYNNARDHLAKYINYFEKFYDKEKELLSLYIYMKTIMDTGEHIKSYSVKNFEYDLQRSILNYNSSIFMKVNQMNEENYCLNLSYKNSKVPVLQYTNRHAKLMMRASVLMKLIIPLITHYMYRTNILNAHNFILEIFSYILYNLCDGVNIVAKLHETSNTIINKHVANHPVLWSMQDIRGISPQLLSIGCTENIIVAIMPKYIYTQNMIHLNCTSIQNGPKYQITDVPFEYAFVMLSSTNKDEDNNSDFDKFESFLTRENESKYLCIHANYVYVMNMLETVYGPIDNDEILFYCRELSVGEKIEKDENGEEHVVQDERSCIKEFQKNMIFLLFYKYFGNSYSLREINYIEYIKLIIIAKRMLLQKRLVIFPYIISGRFETSKVKGINIKEKARMESNRLYEDVKKKYSNDKEMLETVLEFVSKILASKITIVDYDNEALNGKPIPNVNDLIIEETLMYILMI